jgi:superfamily II DNA or RNA helicase
MTMSLSHDLIWLPSADDIGSLGGPVPIKRVLTLEGIEATGFDGAEVRSFSAPMLLDPKGCHVFRLGASWCAVVGPAVEGQARFDRQDRFDDRAPEMEPVRFFDHLWSQATPLEARAAPFQPGDTILLRGSDRRGVVRTCRWQAGEWWLTIFVDGTTQNVRATGVEAVHEDDGSGWVRQDPASAQDFGLTLSLVKLDNPLTDTIYSYLSSKTVFRPYQFRPILRLLGSSHQRLLIADEVGLGKTIEAGLVWTELDQRDPVRRALVVCPANLVHKWQSEMRNRFDRDLRQVDGEHLGQLLDLVEREDQDQPWLGVISLERLRSSRHLDQLVRSHPRFDLVIVDEAHNLRNRDTRSFVLGQHLSDWADTLLFLSATPVNLGEDDLFNLLHLLVEEEFGERSTFALQLEPNRHLNRASQLLIDKRSTPRQILAIVRQVEQCQLGGAVMTRPEYERLCRLLDRDTSLEYAEVAEGRHLLNELNVISSVLTRTRKVDVPDAKAVREARAIDVEWTDAEVNVYQLVSRWALQRVKARGGIPGFATIMPLRQAASCLPALRLTVDRYLPSPQQRPPNRLEDDDFDDFDLEEDGDDAERELQALSQELSVVLRELGGTDTKFERFEETLRNLRQAGLNQLMVFSFFRNTLAYLHRRLAGRFRVEVMHGGVPMEERINIMKRFREGKFDILLLSEVGSEGLDFEFCGSLVNYDLPWNPMRVEQRIGRLDRFGQRHEKIFIYNFHVPGTIETDILERLYNRIKVFEASIGELEPILRSKVDEITKIVVDPNLSEEQRRRRLDEVAIAVENKKVELERLDEAAAFLHGVDGMLIDGFERDRTERGRFVGPAEIEAVLRRFLIGTKARLVKNNERDGLYELVGDDLLAERVERTRVPPGGSSLTKGQWVNRLRDGECVFITFDNELASRWGWELMSLRHPLIRAARRHFADEVLLPKFGSVRVSGQAPGQYLVAFHLLEATGVRPRLELQPIGVDLATGEPADEVGFAVLRDLAAGDLRDGPPEAPIGLDGAWLQLEERMRRVQASLEEEYGKLNRALIEARRGSQAAAFDHKIERAQRTLEKVLRDERNPSVIRLYEGRIANLRIAKSEALDRLKGQEEMTVTSTPVGVALVTVG